MNCINCGIATGRCNTIQDILLEDEAVLSLIREWTGLQTINNEHHICSSCWTLANQAIRDAQQGIIPTPTVGHRSVCVNCGRSVLRTRFHSLNTSTEREARIRNVIREWITPKTVGLTSRICHSCWMKADRASRHFVPRPSTSSGSNGTFKIEPLDDEDPDTQHNENIAQNTRIYVDRIILPDYIRAPETESRCFIGGCRRQERNRISLSTRKTMLQNHNYYIPPNNRLCNNHTQNNPLELFNMALNHSVSYFTAEQIQDMLLLNKCEA